MIKLLFARNQVAQHKSSLREISCYLNVQQNIINGNIVCTYLHTFRRTLICHNEFRVIKKSSSRTIPLENDEVAGRIFSYIRLDL